MLPVFSLLSTDPVVDVLRGGLVFERGVLALAVVGDFDVLEALRFHLTKAEGLAF